MPYVNFILPAAPPKSTASFPSLSFFYKKKKKTIPQHSEKSGKRRFSSQTQHLTSYQELAKFPALGMHRPTEWLEFGQAGVGHPGWKCWPCTFETSVM